MKGVEHDLLAIQVHAVRPGDQAADFFPYLGPAIKAGQRHQTADAFFLADDLHDYVLAHTTPADEVRLVDADDNDMDVVPPSVVLPGFNDRVHVTVSLYVARLP